MKLVALVAAVLATIALLLVILLGLHSHPQKKLAHIPAAFKKTVEAREALLRPYASPGVASEGSEGAVRRLADTARTIRSLCCIVDASDRGLTKLSKVNVSFLERSTEGKAASENSRHEFLLDPDEVLTLPDDIALQPERYMVSVTGSQYESLSAPLRSLAVRTISSSGEAEGAYEIALERVSHITVNVVCSEPESIQGAQVRAVSIARPSNGTGLHRTQAVGLDGTCKLMLPRGVYIIKAVSDNAISRRAEPLAVDPGIAPTQAITCTLVPICGVVVRLPGKSSIIVGTSNRAIPLVGKQRVEMVSDLDVSSDQLRGIEDRTLTDRLHEACFLAPAQKDGKEARLRLALYLESGMMWNVAAGLRAIKQGVCQDVIIIKEDDLKSVPTGELVLRTSGDAPNPCRLTLMRLDREGNADFRTRDNSPMRLPVGKYVLHGENAAVSQLLSRMVSASIGEPTITIESGQVVTVEADLVSRLTLVKWSRQCRASDRKADVLGWGRLCVKLGEKMVCSIAVEKTSGELWLPVGQPFDLELYQSGDRVYRARLDGSSGANNDVVNVALVDE